TKVMITKKGISEFALYDEDQMIEEYGFTPTQFIDYKGLMGDPSDNIPGLPGVGPKTAQKLILEYGSVEGLLENTEQLKGKLKTTVEENAQLAVMSKRLATIHTGVPLEIDFESYRWREPDHDALVDHYVKLEFNRFLKKLKGSGSQGVAAEEAQGEVQGRAEAAVNRIVEEEINQSLVQSAAFPQALLDAIGGEAPLVMKVFGDDNHKARPQIYGVALLCEREYFYLNTGAEGVLSTFVQQMKEHRPKLMGHELKKDYYQLMHEGLEELDTAFDTAIGEYVLDAGRSSYDLGALFQEYFHREIEAEAEILAGNEQMELFTDFTGKYSEYGLNWCMAVGSIAAVQEARLKEEELETVFYTVELPLILVMAYMEYMGFAVDKRELEEIGKGIHQRVDRLTEEIHQLAGETFNIKSPTQLGPILFEKLGLTAGKKTKRGYSTGAEVLEKIKEEHPIVPLILEYRTLTKLTGTYIDGLIPLINSDGKIHAHYNQTITTTGRISSSDPNLQNIPIRQELGRKIRKAFVPSSSEYLLMGADYSQIELRVLAHMSGDPLLIEAFNQGEDIHRATAARVLGIPEGEITPLQRSRAKAVNFGVIYGMSAFGLSTELSITRKEADAYIKNYFSKHEAVKAFMDEQVRLCKEQGFVTTIMGRKRRINEITASNYMVRQVGERLAMNSPIQGSAADIIKIAMVKIHHALAGYRSRLILQVHDELIIETHRDEEEEVKALLTKAMESAMELKVKLAVDLNEGENWYQLK
ncbi:MAG: DNA polymerase I, partial [Anaerovoracaceae bacterium]